MPEARIYFQLFKEKKASAEVRDVTGPQIRHCSTARIQISKKRFIFLAGVIVL